MLFANGAILVLFTLACAAFAPQFLKGSAAKLDPAKYRGLLTEVRWVILVLGLSNAVTISASCYAGILTGCHRWDLNSSVLMVQNVVSLAVSAAIIILTGHGLVPLAVTQVADEAAGRTARAALAYRVCPGLAIRWKLFHWEQAREMLGFGGKSFISQLSNLVLNSTVDVLITRRFKRGHAAVRQPTSLMRNGGFHPAIALIFTRLIGSMQAAGRMDAVVELTVNSVRYCALICLPLLLTLGIGGAGVMTLWMDRIMPMVRWSAPSWWPSRLWWFTCP